MTDAITTGLFVFAVTVFTYKLTQKWLANRIELMIDMEDATPQAEEERGRLMSRLLRFYELDGIYGIAYNDDQTFSYYRK